jgi:hypothetical protein
MKSIRSISKLVNYYPLIEFNGIILLYGKEGIHLNHYYLFYTGLVHQFPKWEKMIKWLYRNIEYLEGSPLVMEFFKHLFNYCYSTPNCPLWDFFFLKKHTIDTTSSFLEMLNSMAIEIKVVERDLINKGYISSSKFNLPYLLFTTLYMNRLAHWFDSDSLNNGSVLTVIHLDRFFKYKEDLVDLINSIFRAFLVVLFNKKDYTKKIRFVILDLYIEFIKIYLI